MRGCRKIHGPLAYVIVFLLFQFPLQAQRSSVLIPRALQNSQSVTGLAFANPSSDAAQVQIQLLDDSGLGLSDVVDLILLPNSQDARNLEEYFGPVASETEGWVLAFSENISVVGFFLSFNPDVSRIDGAEGLTGAQLAGGLVFPELLTGPGEFTDLTIVGFGEEGIPLQVDLALVDSAGTVLETVSTILPPFSNLGSRFSGRVSDIFSVAVPAAAYVRVSGDGVSMVGYEEFGDDDSSAGRNAIPFLDQAIAAPGGATSLFGAQLVSGFGLESTLTVINPTQSEAQVVLRATATGVPNGAEALTAQRTLPAGALLREAAADAFTFSGDFLGWLEVESDIVGLVGDVTFGAQDGRAVSSVQLQHIPVTDVVYSQVAQGPISFTGITFLNANDAANDVDVEVYSANGLMTGQGQFTLAAGEHRPQVVPELIGDADFEQSGGFIRVRSQLPIYSFELFGFTDEGLVTSLSAVPPQRINGRVAGQVTFPAAVTSIQAQQPDMGPVFVVAVDPSTGQTQHTMMTTVEADYAFPVSEEDGQVLIFSGTYELFAGTDGDGDGVICEGEAEEFCGQFSNEEGPTVVVLPGEETSGLNIDLTAGGTASGIALGSPRRIR